MLQARLQHVDGKGGDDTDNGNSGLLETGGSGNGDSVLAQVSKLSVERVEDSTYVASAGVDSRGGSGGGRGSRVGGVSTSRDGGGVLRSLAGGGGGLGGVSGSLRRGGSLGGSRSLSRSRSLGGSRGLSGSRSLSGGGLRGARGGRGRRRTATTFGGLGSGVKAALLSSGADLGAVPLPDVLGQGAVEAAAEELEPALVGAVALLGRVLNGIACGGLDSGGDQRLGDTYRSWRGTRRQDQRSGACAWGPHRSTGRPRPQRRRSRRRRDW